MIPACPSLMCSFSEDKIEGTNSFDNLCLIFMYECFVLCLCRDWFCGFDLRKGFHEKRFFLNVHNLLLMEP